MMFSLCRGLLVALGLVVSVPVAAHQQSVLVGGYPYPPFVERRGASEYEGATLDLLEALNAWQTTVDFQFVPVAAFSRQLSFRQHRFDVMFFESPGWGWASEAVSVSEPIARDRDLYLALDKRQRDQSFFDSIEDRQLIATRGYHYSFADYQTDEAWLKANFDITFSPNLMASLEMLERERGEVAVLNESFLRSRENRGLDLSGFLLSEKIDHAYRLGVVVRDDGPVELTWLIEQLRAMREAGRLTPIEQEWGVRFTDF